MSRAVRIVADVQLLPSKFPCLAQDFPVVPIIGPLAVSELDDSLEALDITLTAKDVRWLEEG